MYPTTPTPLYVQFEPLIEWETEDDCNTLLIYLPGFTTEQLRVRLRSRTLIISGERELHDNRWSRFRKEFLVSEQCIVNKISAKFEESILFVKQSKYIAHVGEQEGKPPIKAPSPMPENPMVEPIKHLKVELEDDTKTTQSNGKNGVGQNAKDDPEKNADLEGPKGVCENVSQKKASDVANKIVVLVVVFVVGVYCSNAIKYWIA